MYSPWMYGILILALQQLVGGRLLLDSTDYCFEQFRCGATKHLMCRYQKKMESKFCGKMLVDTDAQLRQEISLRVNTFRQSLARGEAPSFPGGASNMRLVSWDYELENMAEAWTLKYMDRLLVGENFTKPCTKTEEFPDGTSILVYILGPDVLARDSIAVWTKKPLPPQMAGHFQPDSSNGSESYDKFATVVWAETYRIGCSVVSCSPFGYSGLRSLPQITVIACLFGPKGTIPGKEAFRSGTTCSECPKKTKCRPNSVFPDLCALEGDFEQERYFPVAKLAAFLLPLISIISLVVILMKLKFDTLKHFLALINESQNEVMRGSNLSADH